ncbi:MAG: Smr/MutS family protein [Chloroflexi bacterium]|nr:Smr/MutS family protein [Chloroflexota bacterium]
MDSRAVTTLEFDKIRERLAERTSFAAGRELALALEPSNGRRAVEYGLRETSEAKLIFELQPDFSVRSAHDVRHTAANARIGALLEPATLLEVQDTLESGTYVRGVLLRFADRVPILADRAQTIDPCSIVLRAIKDSIGERGQVLDTASPELARIRTQLRTAYNRLMDSLQRIMDAAASRGQLQEPLITMRAGRYVVPVRAEARNQFRGIVHDQSASGATVFMEPLATVELNNEWRRLQLEEEHEIERVLRHLSGLVGQFCDRIIANVNTIAAIDLALAKAKYAYSLRAVEPVLEESCSFHLVQARHPLLTGNVVPIDIRLGRGQTPVAGEDLPLPLGEGWDEGSASPPLPLWERGPGGEGASKDFTALVITGPNTGGKTVALKTAGLLQLMAQAGMHVPAEPGSTVAIFDEVFADIGDEQSIEQSLSTFSSHMTNIVRILDHADERSLVLLDELGAGTDPQEGSALARAILSYLIERNVPTIATTHYSELKAYAYSQPGVQNASVEFDVESLRPTYRLIIGLPGRSNALAIAQRLGLPEPILAAARGLLTESAMQIEDLLGAIQSERDTARDERLRVQRLREEIETQGDALARRLDAIEDERAAALEAAAGEARALLDEARQRIRRAEAQVGAAGGDRLAVLRAVKDVQHAAEEIVARPTPHRRRPAAVEETPRPIGAGDRVELRRLKAVGEVLGDPDERGDVEIQLGGLRTRANVRELSRVTRREAEQRIGGPERGARVSAAGRPARSDGAVRLPPPPSVSVQIDVRGARADEVVPRVERYLSDAYLAGMPFVRIIHGKGTGVLRQIIRDYLATNPMVESFQSASQAEGGEGATIAHLAV